MSKRLYLVLSDKCNRKCEYCFERPHSGKISTTNVEDIVSLISDALSKNYEVYFQGAETFYYPDIKYIIKKFENQLSITTNGDFINDYDMNLFKEIIISIHDEISNKFFTKFEKIYNKIKAFNIVVHNFNYLRVIKDFLSIDTKYRDKIEFVPYFSRATDKTKDDYYLSSSAKKYIEHITKQHLRERKTNTEKYKNWIKVDLVKMVFYPNFANKNIPINNIKEILL